MPPSVADKPVKFHLSLNVASLERSVEFYARVFGAPPAKRHDDYAKFELDEPPLVFSLVPRAAGSGGTLSHVGLCVPDEPSLQAVRGRLEAAGLAVEMQGESVCSGSRKTRCWFKDPDGNFWEVYCVGEDMEPASTHRGLDGEAARPESEAGPVVWEHYVSHP